ncbi:chemotaxis protein CheX [Helicobacter mesocricetorum]|uniref:chemotaxis protein CheX n=1 Tax=Helicobacter mesocricetorum TaxID=87012 RepID=UPI000CF0E166|nr:chemotaxis protein CheX [Helicobacter mesocricetorum]
MKPIIENNVAIYIPDIELEMKQAKQICDVLVSSSATIRSLSLKAIYFSFENIESFDESSVMLIAKALLAMHNKISIAVAFIGYNSKQYAKLKSLLPNKSLPLFKTKAMADLLLGLKMPPLNQTILYYDTDGMVQTLISQELKGKGYDVLSINTPQEFSEKKKQFSDKAFYLYDIYFDVAANFIPIAINNGIVTYTLYKKVDKNISLSFNIQRHNARLKEGYKVFIFDASETQNFDVAVLDFIMSLALNGKKFDAHIAVCGLNFCLADKDKLDSYKRAQIFFFDSMEECKKDSRIQELAKQHQIAEQNKKNLTKQLMAQLPIFINASLETLSSLTGGEVKRLDYKVKNYTQTGEKDIMGATISFEGDISGTLALCFSKEIVKEASTMLFGEESQSDEELLDVISEFANIIAGRSKALLAEHNISIGISLPKSYSNEEEMANLLIDKQGVQINLALNDKPLNLFLTY